MAKKFTSTWKKGDKYEYHIGIQEDIIIHDQEKFEMLKSFRSEELIEYRHKELPGLNEVAIAIIDPEFYTVARSIGDEAYSLKNKGVLPTQKSIRWREMSKDDILHFHFQLHPYSSKSDLGIRKKDFPGENNTLFLQLRKGGLLIENSRGYKEVRTYGFIEEDEEDIIGEVYSIVPTFD